MRAYYNDHDRFACDWLQGLMDAELITPGKIDDRSIHDVSTDDVSGCDRVHWFAGIGGWERALKLAGWGDAPVWTASCPCQPFSGAGKRQGEADERHLWPALHGLIAECAPATVIGEQVASRDGREWLAGVRLDLEELGYACGGADLCSAGVGSPNIRQRLWWVADSTYADGRFGAGRKYGAAAGDGCGLADSERSRRQQQPLERPGQIVEGEGAKKHILQLGDNGTGVCGWLGDSTGERCGEAGECGAGPAQRSGLNGRLDNPSSPRHAGPISDAETETRDEARMRVPDAGCGSDFWRNSITIPCTDGKLRRVPAAGGEPESFLFPLAPRLPNGMGSLGTGLSGLAEVAGLDSGSLKRARRFRVGALRGSGNAINPHVAAEFIRAVMVATASGSV
jgi:DNA (cytosine-5)-methyltransferase 1